MGHHHGHHGHDHGHGAIGRALWASMALTLLLGAIQVGSALWFDSLALAADAVHNLSDVVAVGLAVGAAWLAGLPARGRRTYGYRRAEVLAATVNSLLLIGLTAWIAWAGVQRLVDPPMVDGAGVAVVGAIAVVLNAIPVVLLVRAGSSRNMNAQAAMLHFAADVLSSLAAMAAGVVIAVTGWERADAVASLLVALLIGIGAVRVLRSAVRVLLEEAPAGVDIADLGRALASEPGVRDVHDLHVWQISDGFPALTAHVVVEAGVDQHAMLHRLEAVVREQCGIEHTTIQIDLDHARGLVIRPRLEQPTEAP
jgi:cobalt-zinc-cadmium efflux system protein